MTKRYQHSIKRPRHRYSVKTKVTRVFGAGLVLSAIGLATFTLESPGTHGTELTSSNNVPLRAAGALDACSDANFSLGNAGYFGLYALGANGAVSTVTDDDVTGAAVFGGTVDTTHYVVNDNNVGDAKLYKGLALYAPDAVDEAGSGSYAFLVDGDGYNTNVNADIEANHSSVPSSVTVSIAKDNAQLYADSAAWHDLATTSGAQATEQYTSLSFVGTNATLNVFNLSATMVSDIEAGTTVTVNVPDTSTVLINVPGTAPDLAGITSFSLLNNVSPSQILWNFDAATTVTLDSVVQWQGAILAPYASLTGSSQMDGNVIVNAFNENDSTEVHDDTSLFVGCIPQPAVSITKGVSPVNTGAYGPSTTFTSSSSHSVYFKVTVANTTIVNATGVVIADPYTGGLSGVSSFSCVSTGIVPCPTSLTATAITGPGATISVPANTTYVMTFAETVPANTRNTPAVYTTTTDGSCPAPTVGTTTCSANVTVTVPAAASATPPKSEAPPTSVTPPPSPASTTTPHPSSVKLITGPPAPPARSTNGLPIGAAIAGSGILGVGIVASTYRKKRRIA